jgi:hypothetical protein
MRETTTRTTQQLDSPTRRPRPTPPTPERDHPFFSAEAHPAIACCLAEPSGSGEALTISSQTSRAALRVASTLPLEALSQIASIFVLVAEESVGIALAPRLHDSVAVSAAGLFAAPVVAVELGVLPLVELLLELLELPQPVSSATPASGINSHVESVRII